MAKYRFEVLGVVELDEPVADALKIILSNIEFNLTDIIISACCVNMKTSERSNYFSRDYFKKEGGAINE